MKAEGMAIQSKMHKLVLMAKMTGQKVINEGI